ncbi:hypothetical protein QFC22_004533 [Naganishia vaughanmartiniae]|uniref:Uncharacterized protein n=1 Tax=Naganishia vaughanmartiniae TaxID=1424756 RepID=A0ACC2X1E4_9TREE|nr:hypothetical protein QFC22_004533 [Naganishia vaughanmartiniae]
MNNHATVDCGHLPFCLAAQKRIKENPEPILSLCSAGSGKKPKYPANFWFWLLYFTIPVTFSCRIAIIETFETIFRGKAVFDPNDDADNAIWAHPLATFIYIACEFLVPTAPFGGFGGGKSVLFWGQKCSRNTVIAKILSVVMGVTFSAKQISSCKQMIIKDLLNQYADCAVADFRGNLAVALHRMAGSTPLRTYFASYLDFLPYHETENGGWKHYRLKLAVRRLIAYGTITLKDNLGDQRHLLGNHLAFLHPFLAFFLGPRGGHMTSNVTSFLTSDTALLSDETGLHGEGWWNHHVMQDSEEKAECARLQAERYMEERR